MRIIDGLVVFAPLALAACTPACGWTYFGGGEATVSLSNIEPDAPDTSWTVRGLTEAEVEAYEEYGPWGSLAEVGSYVDNLEEGAYLVAAARPDEDEGSTFYADVPIDGFLDACVAEPLVRMTVEFSNRTGGKDLFLSFYTETGEIVSQSRAVEVSTVDFGEGRYTGTQVDMRGSSDCLGGTDIEVVWEVDASTRNVVPSTCPRLF